MKVMVLSAISREDSVCYLVATKLCDMARARGVDVDFAHPSDANLPINDGTLDWDDPRSVAWRGRVAASDAYLWVSPEYHSGMAGGMKNLFDHLSTEPMKGDVVGLFAIASGAMAALNTVNNMSAVARSMGAWVAPDYCTLADDELDAGLDDKVVARIEAVIDQVIDTARRLHADD